MALRGNRSLYFALTGLTLCLSGCASQIELTTPPTLAEAAARRGFAGAPEFEGDIQPLPVGDFSETMDFSNTAGAGLGGGARVVQVRMDGRAFPGGAVQPIPMQTVFVERGIASWYADEWVGKKTANGEVYNPNAYTAAHRTLPFGSVVQVRNVANGRAVYVRINNRGPFYGDRVIDVSPAAAKDLDFYGNGIAQVEIRRVR